MIEYLYFCPQVLLQPRSFRGWHYITNAKIQERMKVLKFGGTSVGSVKSILSLKRIVENEAKKQSVVVVVSALGGITDKLLQTSQLALKGDEQWKVEFDAMVDRHHKMIDTIITETTDRENLFKSVDALFEQLRSIYFGVYLIHDLSRSLIAL